MKARARAWSDEELKRLAKIVAAGRSAVRAAVALKRRIVSCQDQAREIGTPFKSAWAVRKEMKVKIAAAEQSAGGDARSWVFAARKTVVISLC